MTSVPTLEAMVRAYVARHPTALCEEGRVALKDVLARCTELDAAVGHVRAFGEMLTGRLGCHAPTASPKAWQSGSRTLRWRTVREAGLVAAVR
ncbi:MULTISPECIES: hypothetical protein [Streptomyces]|uniref:hypothetical protein n=1 Tax=Streptomyces TaxID=1883 RepID=UPI000EAFFEF7|nr:MULTISPECIES: hypothetical protein [Streptomyces]